MDFFSLGAFADTAVLEGFSSIQADNGALYPYSIIAGGGRVIYYTPNGDAWTRKVEVVFVQSLANGSQDIESLIASTPETANPLRFRDTDASRHSTKIILTVADPVFTGRNANDPNFGPECIWIDAATGECFLGPGYDSDHTFTNAPSGTLRFRAYRRGTGLAMTLSRSQLTPVVLGGQFRVASQANGRLRAGVFTVQPRFDTLRIRVAPRPGSSPMPGVQVWIEAVPVATSGFHLHTATARPTGTFFDLSQISDVSDSSAGSRGSLGLTLPDSGIVSVVYRTSGLGGNEILRIHRDSLHGAILDSAIVTLRIQGLVQLLGGGNVSTIGANGNHLSNHWGTPELQHDLVVLADSLRAVYNEDQLLPPAERPIGRFPTILGVNDMSLPWGGLFDYDSLLPWQNPHAEHREGKSADIDVQRGAGDDYYDRVVLRLWTAIRRGNDFNPERQSGNHQHLRVP